MDEFIGKQPIDSVWGDRNLCVGVVRSWLRDHGRLE